jgi:alkanesulfonate monooxygenase SsuD/methylene tetrahydromethanopterin reductase-like flavin-dependent oxidoreductase (luciferase family)
VRRAEAEGYDTTWVFDHFDGATIRGDRPMLECFTLLGAMAEATTTIGLGALVANVANRHPAVLAAAAHSVQRISGGRLRLGIGAGTAPASRWAREHHDRGIPLHAAMADRHAAVVRQIAVLRDTGDAPVIVGVNSVELARLAGQHADGVNVGVAHPRAADFVAAAREAAGNRSFEVSGWAFARQPDTRQLAGELQLDRLVLTRLESLDT